MTERLIHNRVDVPTVARHTYDELRRVEQLVQAGAVGDLQVAGEQMRAALHHIRSGGDAGERILVEAAHDLVRIARDLGDCSMTLLRSAIEVGEAVGR